MIRRHINVSSVDDMGMVRLAQEYGCSITAVYQRAVSLYLLTQSRVETMGDFWPGEPGTEEVSNDGAV